MIAWIGAIGWRSVKALGSEALFVKIDSYLPLSCCHLKVYHGFRRLCQGLRLLRLPLRTAPFDERLIPQRVAPFGGVPDVFGVQASDAVFSVFAGGGG